MLISRGKLPFIESPVLASKASIPRHSNLAQMNTSSNIGRTFEQHREAALLILCYRDEFHSSA